MLHPCPGFSAGIHTVQHCDDEKEKMSEDLRNRGERRPQEETRRGYRKMGSFDK